VSTVGMVVPLCRHLFLPVYAKFGIAQGEWQEENLRGTAQKSGFSALRGHKEIVGKYGYLSILTVEKNRDVQIKVQCAGVCLLTPGDYKIGQRVLASSTKSMKPKGIEARGAHTCLPQGVDYSRSPQHTELREGGTWITKTKRRHS